MADQQDKTAGLPGDAASPAKGEEEHRPALLPLSLTALGVVYGDIGTSPLYALRECFHGTNRFPATAENVLGVLSLIFWALILVISIKYLLFILRADNRGEGGILALLALLHPWGGGRRPPRRVLLLLGLFGAALLYGDGVITPAISVLSAVEGLQVAAPATGHLILPLAILILILLFLFQKRGTAGVGSVFGPVMVVWFAVLALLGVAGILRAPAVLAAVDPRHAVFFFLRYGGTGFLVLGTVFLVVTGGEALYADMGHFGPRAIRTAWFGLVLPALLLNYFGQGALLLRFPAEATQPFYHLAPDWARYPLVLLATAATVIASQAVISGAFSLTRQAVQLGQLPRLRIVQTSASAVGQIYIPAVNWLLMIVTIALVLGFRTSSRLASAYGVAVTTTMVITTVLAFYFSREHWGWSRGVAALIAGFFLTIDLSFFSANMTKIIEGGWFPLLAGGVVYLLMATWRRGREILAARLQGTTEPLADFLARITAEPPLRVPGTAVFMTSRFDGTPPMLLHHLAHNQVLHEKVILMTIITEAVPRVPAAERLEITRSAGEIYQVAAHYGFMQSPNVPVALRACEPLGLHVEMDSTTFYLGRETLIPTPEEPGMAVWREKLFAFMSRNALRSTAFFNIPPERVVEIGIQIKI